MEISLKLTPIFLFQYLFFLILFPGCGAVREDCKLLRCSDQGPVIGYPFRIVTKQPEHCGYPGYELYCNHLNQTMLDLPVSVKVVVREINYLTQTIDVYDPHSCLPRQLLSLNLSAASPIRFLPIGRLSFVAFFNCPPPERTFGHLVPCLGVGDYRVYAITDGSFVDIYDLTSCIKIHKISPATIDMIPIQPDMYEREKNIQFTWITPDCWSCEANGNICSVWDYNTPGLPAYECLDTFTAVASKKPELAGSSKKLLVTGVVVGTIFLALVIIAFYRAYTLNKMRKEDQAKIETFLDDYEALNPTRYTFADIKKITNQFKHKLGEGGYGTVFKGNLSSEVFVAVKVLNISIGNGEDFINEVRTMGRIHHVNVVRFVGFCADGIRRALVYEFLPNESLEKFIFSKIVYLGWEKLRDIALGIAKGIEYLHQGCDHQILHFDIKPHNILLDQNFNPKIADFGLAKLCSKEQSVVSMTAARGTMGYIAPEVFSRNFGNVSYKSDVYSFGMMLLEMVGGRKNIDVTINNASQAYFPEWIYNRLYRGEELQIRIANEEHHQIAKKLTVVGLWCIQWSPLDRPSMKTVVQMLEDKGDALTIPPNPFGPIIQSKSSTTLVRDFNKDLAVISEME